LPQCAGAAFSVALQQLQQTEDAELCHTKEDGTQEEELTAVAAATMVVLSIDRNPFELAFVTTSLR
jgi:hypothetical protein